MSSSSEDDDSTSAIVLEPPPGRSWVVFAAAAAAAALAASMGRQQPPTERGMVRCQFAPVAPFAVRNSVLNDGIEDCCDGSDEGRSGVGRCLSEARARLAEIVARRAMVARGVEARSELAAIAAEVARSAAEWVAEAQEVLRALETEARRSFAAQRRFEYAVARVREERVVASLEPTVFGTDGAWLALRGRCFDSAPLSEKQTLGGTSKIEPTQFVFRVCPLANVSQLEESRSTLLGTWHAWVEIGGRRGDRLLDAPSHNLSLSYADPRSSLQFYDQGAPCNDRPRRVLASATCAEDHAVRRVDEDGLCTYLIDFETPLACETSELSTLDAERRALRAKLAFSSWWFAYARLGATALAITSRRIRSLLVVLRRALTWTTRLL